MVYDAIRTFPPGRIVSYDELTGILGRDCRSHRHYLDRLLVELVKDRKTLVNMRNVGYRVARADEHVGLAHNHRRRARRQLFKGMRRLDATDVSKLPPEQARAVENLRIRMSRIEQTVRALNERQQDLETRQEQNEVSAAEVSERVAGLTQQLRAKGLLD